MWESVLHVMLAVMWLIPDPPVEKTLRKEPLGCH
jgi:hypothetical protein